MRIIRNAQFSKIPWNEKAVNKKRDDMFKNVFDVQKTKPEQIKPDQLEQLEQESSEIKKQIIINTIRDNIDEMYSNFYGPNTLLKGIFSYRYGICDINISGSDDGYYSLELYKKINYGPEFVQINILYDNYNTARSLNRYLLQQINNKLEMKPDMKIDEFRDFMKPYYETIANLIIEDENNRAAGTP